MTPAGNLRAPPLDLLRNRRAFAGRLLRWYSANRRDLPWRRSPTPYRTLVSELMLQQTRVETVIPYYRRFLRRFPDFRALARAKESEVLSTWEGLGYYRRARNLLRIARKVCENGGGLPRSARELLALPGIGPYTAAAVASIAFGEAEPVLDSNVERVIPRLLARELPPKSERGVLRELVRGVLPAAHPGEFNQALMELGATVCTPRRPACGGCPVREFCRAFASGNPEAYPQRMIRKASPVRVEVAILVRRGGRILLRQRPAGGLLGGMWSVPSYLLGGNAARWVQAAHPGPRRVATTSGASPALGGSQAATPALHPAALEVLERFRVEAGFPVRYETRLPTIRHAYSHFTLILTPLVCSPVGPSSNRNGTVPGRGVLRWIRAGALADLPMGRVDRRILGSDSVLTGHGGASTERRLSTGGSEGVLKRTRAW